MKIIALEAENLKRLTAVRIEPNGNLVEITGKNGQGKTSVLDAIWWALDGTKNVQTTPIRKGEEKAIIRLDLGELQITRRFNAQEDGTYTTSITVQNSEGARFQSPQSMLDKMLGELTFDPLAFTRMKPADQVMSLRSLVPDFDFDENETRATAAFTQRTERNRTAKEAAAAAQEIAKDLPAEIPEEQSPAELMEKWKKAADHNQLIEARGAKRRGYIESRDEIVARMIELQKSLDEHNAEIESWDELPAPIDADAIRNKMSSIEADNKIAAAAQRHQELLAKAKAAASEAEDLTTTISELKDAARKAIASAEMPVDGLTIEDGAVFLDGVPFDQASDAQQLQASIGIAMALNPSLKVIRVRDGSLLDDEAMAVLAKMADDHDYQIWIERVDSSGTIGFVLEDGHIKGAAPVAEPEPEKPAAKSSLFGDRK